MSGDGSDAELDTDRDAHGTRTDAIGGLCVCRVGQSPEEVANGGEEPTRGICPFVHL